MSGSLVGKLKALSRQRLSADALDDLISEINSGSDRSVAIVWAAMVEDALRIALTKLMPDLSSDTEKRFFEGEGPLSSFSSKILLGFALQTVKTIERTDLDKIREIRNAFAHTIIGISFATPEVAEVCALLNAYKEYPEPPDKPKVQYIATCATLWSHFGEMAPYGFVFYNQTGKFSVVRKL